MAKGVLGFGCSLVWMSLFPLWTTVPEAVGVLQPLAIGLNSLLITQLWHHTSLKDLMPLATSAPVGIVFGLWVVTSWPSRVINGLLGVFLLFYVAKNLRDDYDSRQVVKEGQSTRSSSTSEASLETEDLLNLNESSNEQEQQNTIDGPPRTTTLAFPAGFFGGCLTSAFGTGGPAILVFAREAGWERSPQKFRANLQLIFFSMNVLAISIQAYAGIINKDTFQVSLMLVPALVFGGLFGNSVASRVRKDVFRILVLGGLTVMGALFVLKALQEQQREWAIVTVDPDG